MRLCAKIISVAVFLFFFGSLSAQHYVGVRAGYGNGSSRLYPLFYENSSVWGLYSGGVSWKYYSPERVTGGIEADVLFMQQGFKHYMDVADESGFIDRSYQRTVNTIMVPIFWQPHVYMFSRTLRIFLNAGVTFSYNLSSREKTVRRSTGEIKESKYEMIINRDNRWGYGLCAGGGMGVAIRRFEVFAEFRYYIGYSDILKNRNKYKDTQFLRSPLDGMQLQMGVYYRLGRSGILAAANERVAGRLAEKEAARMARDDQRASRRDKTAQRQEEDSTPQDIILPVQPDFPTGEPLPDSEFTVGGQNELTVEGEGTEIAPL